MEIAENVLCQVSTISLIIIIIIISHITYICWFYDNVKGFDPLAGGTFYGCPKIVFFQRTHLQRHQCRSVEVHPLRHLHSWPLTWGGGFGCRPKRKWNLKGKDSGPGVIALTKFSEYKMQVTSLKLSLLHHQHELGMTTIAMKLLLWEWASDVNCCMTYWNLCRLKTPWVVRLKIPTIISEFSLLTPLFRPANVEANHGWRRASNFPDTSTSAVGPPEFGVGHKKWRETKLFWQQSKYVCVKIVW